MGTKHLSCLSPLRGISVTELIQTQRLDNANKLVQDAIRSLSTTAEQLDEYIIGLRKNDILSQQAFFIAKNHRRLVGEFEYITAALQAVKLKCDMTVQVHAELVSILKEVTLKQNEN